MTKLVALTSANTRSFEFCAQRCMKHDDMLFTAKYVRMRGPEACVVNKEEEGCRRKGTPSHTQDPTGDRGL